MKNRIFATIATIVLTICTVKAQISDMAFTRMDASDGLNDNRVQHIMQLPDGRMAVTTRGNINLYDGAQFRYIHGSERKRCRSLEARGCAKSESEFSMGTAATCPFNNV